MAIVRKLVLALGTAIGITLATEVAAIAATFQYETFASKATYTEGVTTVAGSAYDGTFTNAISNPLSGEFQIFSGFYRVQSGQLGEAVSLRAIQQSPTDRTDAGIDEISLIDYLAALQPTSTVPDGFAIPFGITEFDFKFVPGASANLPAILSNGWTAESVPESDTALALLGLGLLMVGLSSRRSSAVSRDAVLVGVSEESTL